MAIKSEDFGNVYAIFINQKSLPVYKEIIKRNNIEEAVGLFKATFNNDLAMIVLPLNDQTLEYETILYTQSNKIVEESFWGEVGIGYEGKTWEKYD